MVFLIALNSLAKTSYVKYLDVAWIILIMEACYFCVPFQVILFIRFRHNHQQDISLYIHGRHYSMASAQLTTGESHP